MLKETEKQIRANKTLNPCGSAFWLLEFTSIKYMGNPQLTETILKTLLPAWNKRDSLSV